jgi:hypothetical protein
MPSKTIFKAQTLSFGVCKLQGFLNFQHLVAEVFRGFNTIAKDVSKFPRIPQII